jgi:hypothetical protein
LYENKFCDNVLINFIVENLLTSPDSSTIHQICRNLEGEYEMANNFYVPAKTREELLEKITKFSINCLFCGEILKRPRDRNVDFVDYDAENMFTESNAVLCCADCMGARRRRPIGVFVDERFSELTLALAYITSLRSGRLAEIFGAQEEAVRQKPNLQSAKKTAERKPTLEDLVATGWGDDEDDEKPAVGVDVSRIPPDDPRLNLESVMFDQDIYHAWCEYHENL